MKVYKITYSIFGYLPCMASETYHANVRAGDENHAIEKLKTELKNNGHRLNEIIDVIIKER